MNEIIRKRKSIRKYEQTKLDEVTLGQVRAMCNQVIPLYPDIKFSIEIEDKARGALGINAPHFLVFRSEEKEGMYENIGFIGQQMDLYFSERGLGSCWVGMAKPEEKSKDSLSYVICIAFGRPASSLHRNISEFKRKPLNAISKGEDPRLEAARLAPSGINAQKWYFVAIDNKIHTYCKKSRHLVIRFMGNMALMDLGIAICHIATESENFTFVKEPNPPEIKGFNYIGTIT